MAPNSSDIVYIYSIIGETSFFQTQHAETNFLKPVKKTTLYNMAFFAENRPFFSGICLTASWTQENVPTWM